MKSLIQSFTRYDLIFSIGLVLWIIETFYFGLNAKPGTPFETMCDQVTGIIMLYGALQSTVSNIKTVVNIDNGTINVVKKAE